MKKINLNKINNKLKAVSVIALACIVAGSVIFFEEAKEVEAGNVYWQGLSIYNPKPPQVKSYAPGEVVEFSSEFVFEYCSNKWHAVGGQITEPVLKDQPHKDFVGDPFSNVVNQTQISRGRGRGENFTQTGSKTVGNIQSTTLTQAQIDALKATGGLATKTEYKSAPGKVFNSRYNTTFIAPSEPGIYWFKYRVIIKNGQNTGVTKEGVAIFKVQGPDICTNILEHQEVVPVGYVSAQNADGKSICVPQSRNLVCSASKNKLEVGESVTFIARRVNGEVADFNWYKGGSASGVSLKKENGVSQSDYSTSYAQPGLYMTSVLVQKDGISEKCSVGVSVGDLEYVTEQEELKDTYVTDDGKAYKLDPNAQTGKIEFNLDSALTNNTCKADWKADSVVRCSMIKNNAILNNELEFVGQKDLSPGNYQISCIQLKDGTEIRSEVKTCRLSPDVREL